MICLKVFDLLITWGKHNMPWGEAPTAATGSEAWDLCRDVTGAKNAVP